mmetsp:Transcript_44878/g.65598  ORF Transcript_44878/g.65598 Transcript_44878/m.65598 type:complete len:296 (+) Transcript_44878:144-1031(+)
MDYAEEQSMEVEALEAIYMEEYTKIADSPLEYKIFLEPIQGGGEDENHVAIDMMVKYPETYPEVAPEITINNRRGLGDHQIPEIMELVNTTAEENIGMAMIFTIAEAVKEWLNENNVKGADGSMHTAMLQRMEAAKKAAADADAAAARAAAADVDEDEEAEEARRLQRLADGTPVNPETFADWKVRFKAEMRRAHAEGVGAAGGVAAAALAADLTHQATPQFTKPTGRQLFERHLATEGDEEGDEVKLEEDGEDWPEAAQEGGETVEVNTAVFAADDEDLDDLDDLEDSEEEEGG